MNQPLQEKPGKSRILPITKIAMVKGSLLLLVGILIAGWLSKTFLAEPLDIGAQWLVANVGLGGVFVITIIFDSFPTPFSFVPLLVLLIHQGMDPWFAGLFFSGASVTGGFIGIHLGRYIGLPKRLESWAEEKFPGILDWLRERAAIGVAAFAILPLPFSLATWSAGALRAHRGKVMLAVGARIPKVAVLIATLMAGRTVGG